MGNFNELIGKFILAAIIIVSIISFMVITQRGNDSTSQLEDNKIFNQSFSALSANINNSTGFAQEKYNAFNAESPQTGFGSILLFSIVPAAKAFSEIAFGIFGSIIKFPLVVLGIPVDIYSLIITWLIIAIITAVWLLLKLGG